MNLKEVVGKKAVEYVKDGMIVGLGTGSTVFYFVHALADRVKEGLKSTLIMISIMSLIIFSILFIFGRDIIDLFLDEAQSEDAISFAIKYLRVISAFYILKGFMNAYCGVLKGAGDISIFVIATMLNFFIRLIIVYIFSNKIGPSVVYYAIPIGWFVGLLIGYIRYKNEKWKLKTIIK